MEAFKNPGSFWLHRPGEWGPSVWYSSLRSAASDPTVSAVGWTLKTASLIPLKHTGNNFRWCKSAYVRVTFGNCSSFLYYTTMSIASKVVSCDNQSYRWQCSIQTIKPVPCHFSLQLDVCPFYELEYSRKKNVLYHLPLSVESIL